MVKIDACPVTPPVIPEMKLSQLIKIEKNIMILLTYDLDEYEFYVSQLASLPFPCTLTVEDGSALLLFIMLVKLLTTNLNGDPGM